MVPKCCGSRFIQVASNPQSKDPTDVTFFVMRNEQDGDDISALANLGCQPSLEEYDFSRCQNSIQTANGELQ
jgi:hypothetical protein